MMLQVEASSTLPSTLSIASFYLQRHSRDVLNQALPPLFDGVQRSYIKIVPDWDSSVCDVRIIVNEVDQRRNSVI